MWVADRDDAKLYAYNLQAVSTDATLSRLTVDRAAVPGLDANRTRAYEFGVAHDVEQVTIGATTTSSHATVEYSGTDANGNLGGHQIDLSEGVNEVTVTVTSESTSVTKDYVLRVNRGSGDAREWKAADDIDTLITAGNTRPFGIWSNGTTMWVADFQDDKLYAYWLSSGARNSGRTSTSTRPTPTRGIWSNGTTMWVADSDDTLYAYTLSTGDRDTSKEFDLHSRQRPIPPASGQTGPRCGWPTRRRQALRLHAVDRGPRR